MRPRIDKEDIVEYVGIADSEGLDWFAPLSEVKTSTISMMQMRCRLNTHRTPVLFKAILTKQDVDLINTYEDSKRGLIHLKKSAIWVGVPPPLESAQRSWDSIPHYNYDDIHLTPLASDEDDEDEPIQLELDL